MSPGDLLKTSKPIRSQKTGVVLPREGTFVRMVENMGRQLILSILARPVMNISFPKKSCQKLPIPNSFGLSPEASLRGCSSRQALNHACTRDLIIFPIISV